MIIQNNSNHDIKRHILISDFFGNLTVFELESSVPERKRKRFIKYVNFKVARGLYYLYQP